MSKVCKNCNTSNIDASHYCAKCGNPLEYSYYGSEKKYIVVSQSEYDDLKRLKRDHSILTERIHKLESSWWYRLEQKLKGFWEMFIDYLPSVALPLLTVGIPLGLYMLFVSLCTSESLEIVKDNETGKYGLYDNKAEEYVLACQFDKIDLRKGDDLHFYYLYSNNKTGVADRNGNMTIPCDLDSARTFVDRKLGLIRTFSNGKQGLMDHYGKVLIPCKYAQIIDDEADLKILSYLGNIYPVKFNSKDDWSLIDKSAKLITDKRFKNVTQVKSQPDLILVDNGYEKKGLVNVKGEVVLPLEYYYIGGFNDDRAWVLKTATSNWICISPDGKTAFTMSRDYSPYSYSCGLAAVKRTSDNMIGYLDLSGKLVIPFNFKAADDHDVSFVNNEAVVSQNGVVGVIDKSGKFTAR